ncbi:MAG TPA: cytochrome C oxidase subunit II [Cyanobacteria bacterium UBA8803]|nr:cytochrome C oxidase subunit II [Cyanobacteria bacterium UBA9273]HBL59486.1 cytochrome C oxidase subunit II [Cyanobacteria bacterium UBA8803]
MNIPSSIYTLIAGIALTVVSLWYGQNHGLMPVAASDEAGQVDGIFNLMMTVATGLFVLIQGVLIISIFKFRRAKDDNTDAEPIHGNIPLEILWTALPAVTVLIISVYSFEIYNAMGGLDPMASHDHSNMAPVAVTESTSSDRLSPDKGLIALTPDAGAIALGLGASPEKADQSAPLTVNVMGLQYAWIFNYLDSGITSGELHLPVGKEVQLNLSAQDVLHAFWLPEFRLKQDAIPGRSAVLRFTPNKVGQYPVICAELCGAYHGAMKTQLYVHTPEEYQAWIESQQQVANTTQIEKSLAVNPKEASESEFLAPYVSEMGIDSHILNQLATLQNSTPHEVGIHN